MHLIESNIKALQSIFGKPWLLLPAFILPIAMIALLFVFQVQIFNLLVEVFFLENIPESPLAALPVHLIAMYPVELPVVALLVFVFAVISIGIAFFYARAADSIDAGKFSLGKAAGETIAAKGSIAVLGVFFFIIALFLITIAWLFLILSQLNSLVGFVLLILLCLLVFYLFVKLAFTVSAMAIDGIRVKEALLKSWNFTAARFWGALLLLVIVAVVNNIIINIGDFISSLITVEEISIVVFAIFWALGVVYSSLAIAFYYLKNSSSAKG